MKEIISIILGILLVQLFLKSCCNFDLIHV